MPVPTRDEVFLRIINNTNELQSDFATMAHLHSLQDDPKHLALAQGWLHMSELMRRINHMTIELGKAKLIQ